jgi:hypothetical protein
MMFVVEEEYQPGKWKAALVGALICGIFGPVIGAFLTLAREAARQNSFRGAAVVFLVFPYLLPAAVVVMGPAGLIVGSAGSLMLQAVSARVSSIKALAVWATGLGLVLGAAVPPLSAVLSLWSKSSIGEVVPLSIAVGISCGAITVWLLHRWHLLRLPA